MRPPDFAICAAVEAGARSPCAKSKRGAVVFGGSGVVYGVGRNAQPAPFTCTGDARCRAACGKLCEHAEQVAIRAALAKWSAQGHVTATTLEGAQLVHAKVVDGQLVAGGGPSCWQCSRLVLAVRLAAVWLYEFPPAPTECRCGGEFSRVHNESRGCPVHNEFARQMYDRANATWRRYTAEDFHRATLAACGIEVSR